MLAKLTSKNQLTLPKAVLVVSQHGIFRRNRGQRAYRADAGAGQSRRRRASQAIRVGDYGGRRSRCHILGARRGQLRRMTPAPHGARHQCRAFSSPVSCGRPVLAAISMAIGCHPSGAKPRHRGRTDPGSVYPRFRLTNDEREDLLGRLSPVVRNCNGAEPDHGSRSPRPFRPPVSGTGADRQGRCLDHG